MRCIATHFVLAFLSGLMLIVVSAAAQPASVDPTFGVTPTSPLPNDANFNHIVQPDGKVIVYNAPAMIVNGQLRSGMFRLNADGSTDTTFSYNNEGNVGINSIMLAPDGKIVVAGSTAPNHAKMIRLNADGSLDNSFSVLITAVGPPEFTGNFLTVHAVQPDGKVIATHTSWGNIAGTWYSYSMKRYNPDASVDAGFASPTLEGGHLMSTTPLIELLPDGRFYLGITSRSHLGGFLNVTRRLADGTVDPTYTAFQTSIAPSAFLSIEDLSVAFDGGLLVTGQLVQTAIGFPPREQLRRFLPDGSLAPGFASPAVMTANVVHQLPGGKILYTASGGTVSRPLIRLESNGAIDNAYVLDPVITSIKNRWRTDPVTDRPVFLANTAAGPRMVRLLDNGAIDPTFNVQLGVVGSGAFVYATAVQGDGKVLVAGSFSNLNGIARNRFARLNTDGSVDTTFETGTGFNVYPSHILIQPDGKIIVCGNFSSYNGTTLPSIARLNTNGSLDNTFSVTLSLLGEVKSAALQPDGKVVIAGSFSTVNGVNRTAVARVDSNGVVDPTFDVAVASSQQPWVERVLLEPSGKILIGGSFTNVNGVSRPNLARLTSTGATDTSFNATVNYVYGLWRQADGKYIFASNGAPFVRYNVDGSVDTGFTPPAIMAGSNPGVVDSILFLPDGGMLIGGSFGTVGGVVRRNITRLSYGGSHVSSFLPDGTDGRVYTLSGYPGGKVILGGTFTTVAGVTKYSLARLEASALLSSTPFDFDGDGRADVTVYRPSSGVWYQLFSSGGPFGSPTFGLAGDVPVPADYDGDGKTDLAIYRPSQGDWWYRASSDNSLRYAHWGTTGDIPLPADINGDGKDDFVVYRPSNNYWYRITTNGVADDREFGLPGDKPVIGDFDGDGKADQAMFRPSSGDWWYSASSAGGVFRATHWGQNGDVPAPADYDGDGKTDHAVFRPSNGGWYILKSSDLSYIILGFGLNGDRPVPADYDGDGRADIAVFRPSTGVWYVLGSTAGSMGAQWGVSTDVAIPNSFIQP